MREKITRNDIILAYTQGYFPMAHPEEENQIFWHRPERRGIIPLDKFHVPKNLRRTYKKEVFECRMNGNFEKVIRSCADRSETWISDEIIELYLELHHEGIAHSFETYQDGELAGGLYGLSIGKAFFGESMFHNRTDASKVALVYLVEYLRSNDFSLLDVQYLNDHTKQFGGIEIPDQDYQNRLLYAITGRKP